MKQIYKLTNFLVTLVLWLIMFHTSVLGKTIYVDSSAFGANDGSSWLDAYNYLQDALADAKDSEKPVEIRVAQGIYKPDQRADQTSGIRETSFQLIEGVTLTGGYAGSNEADSNERDIGLYETILSGDLHGDDDLSQFVDSAEYLCREYRSSFTHEERQKAMEDFEQYLRNIAHIDDNVYNVVTAYEVDETAVLDGFTITRGNSFIINDFRYAPDMMRGAINIEKAIPIIKNCVVRNNLALNGGGLASFHSTPMIEGCRFEHNFSRSDGGGLWHEYGSPTITDNALKHGLLAKEVFITIRALSIWGRWKM